MSAPLGPEEMPTLVPFGERSAEPRPVLWWDGTVQHLGLLLAWRRQKYPDRRVYWEGLVLTGKRGPRGYAAQMEWVLGYKLQPWPSTPSGSAGG
jgi:hypothetical protein